MNTISDITALNLLLKLLCVRSNLVPSRFFESYLKRLLTCNVLSLDCDIRFITNTASPKSLFCNINDLLSPACVIGPGLQNNSVQSNRSEGQFSLHRNTKVKLDYQRPSIPITFYYPIRIVGMIGNQSNLSVIV